MTPEPKIGDSVYIRGKWRSVAGFSEDHGTLLTGGEWVCASDLGFYGPDVWRYSGHSAPAPDPNEWAASHVTALLRAGKAEELMDAYSFFGQTWHYLAGIIDHVAEEGASMTAQEFARSLQEESFK